MSSIRELHANLSKETLARRLIASINRCNERTLTLIISPLEGGILDEVYEKINTQIPVVSVCFNVAHSKEYAQGKYLENFTHIPLLYGGDIEHTLFQYIQKYHVRETTIVYYSQEAYNYKDSAEKLAYKCAIEIRQFWMNHVTQTYFASSWYKNIWKNLTQPFISAIPDLSYEYHTQDKAGIIIGAGPSLTKEKLDFIRSYQDKLIIFAVDTALPILQTNGIIPHFCVLLESQYYNMQDLIPAPDKSIIALGDLCCYPPTLRAFSRTVCVSTKFSDISFFRSYAHMLPPIIPPLGSVGLMAMYLAIYTRPRYLFIIGLDFSFYRGLSHASHSPAYKRWLNTQSRILPWKSADVHFSNRGLVETGKHRVQDSILEMYRKKTERSIFPLAQKYHVNCMDLNEDSIISSVAPCDLAQAKNIVNRCGRSTFAWRNTLDIGEKTVYYDHIESIPNSDRHFSSLAQLEQERIDFFSRRIQELSKSQEVPSQEDWDNGLDNYTTMLSEDPYLLKHNKDIWTENNIYNRLYITMQYINSVIESLK